MTLRKIDLMHHEFGRYESHICAECENIVTIWYRDKKIRKCKVYGVTHSEASDWTKRWTACGMFNKTYNGRPIIKLVRKCSSAANEPLKEQVSFDAITKRKGEKNG